MQILRLDYKNKGIYKIEMSTTVTSDANYKKKSPFYTGFMNQVLINMHVADIGLYVINKLLSHNNHSTVYDTETPIVLYTVKSGLSRDSSNVYSFNSSSLTLRDDKYVFWTRGFWDDVGGLDQRVKLINSIVKELKNSEDDMVFTRPPNTNMSVIMERIIKEGGITSKLIKEYDYITWEHELYYLIHWLCILTDFQILRKRLNYHVKKAQTQNKLVFIGLDAVIANESIGHRLSLIVDTENKVIEFYDPNGSRYVELQDSRKYQMEYDYHFEYFKPLLSHLFKDLKYELKYYAQSFPKDLPYIGTEMIAAMFDTSTAHTDICCWYSLRHLYLRAKTKDPLELYNIEYDKFLNIDSADALMELYSFCDIILGNIIIGKRNFMDIAYELYILGCERNDNRMSFYSRITTLINTIVNKYNLYYPILYVRKSILRTMKSLYDDDIIDKELEYLLPELHEK